MGNHNWIGFIAFRYLSRSKKRRKSAASVSSIFAIAGIAIGVFALIIVIGIMNGFQIGFMESILEISSFHLRIELPEDGNIPIFSDKRIRSYIPFTDFQGLLRGNRRNQQVVLVRGLPANTAELDPDLVHMLNLQSGSFDITRPDAIILGTELARSLALRPGDTVSLASIAGDLFTETKPELNTFVVTGLFRSNFYEFDSGWAFINLDRALALQEGTGKVQLGIKLRDRWQDQQLIRELSGSNPELAPRITSWRDYNRSFFGALRTEKLIMFFLIGLIFVVVSLNIYQSQRKTVLERREEIGLLRALGASVPAIQTIFITDGFIIGFSGATVGLILALWVAGNLKLFFTVLEELVNSLLGIGNALIRVFSHSPVQDQQGFAFFSPQVFYLKDIPCTLVPTEVAIIYLFGILSATLAALWAAGSLSKLSPAEVLRYDQ